MGFTTMIKAVMVLCWLCVIGAQRHNSPVGILFPGDQVGQISQKPRCTNNLLDEDAPCEFDSDYNESVEHLFRHLLTRFRGNQVVRNEFFQNLTLPELVVTPSSQNDVKDPLFEYDPLCASEETIIFPKRAKTRSNDWVFVLNQGKRKQAVKVEKCRNNNQPCNLGAARTEVDSVCRQKYIYKKLLVMNGAGTNIIPESVLMPSCCVCYIKKERNFGGFVGFRTRNNNGGNNVGSINGQINGQRRNSNQFLNRGINTGLTHG